MSKQTFTVPQTLPASTIRTYIHLPLRNSADLDKLIQQQSTKGNALYHHWLTPDQFRAAYGPTPQSLSAAASALQSYGFKTTLTSQGVIADASQATIEKAFGVHLTPAPTIAGGNTSTMVTNRPFLVPQALARLGAHIDGFARAPKPTTNIYELKKVTVEPENRYSPVGPYFPDDLKQAYQFPSYQVANGAGTTTAIVAIGDFFDSDIAEFFGFNGIPEPSVIRRPVDGGPPPANPNYGGTVEVTADIQQTGATAPKTKIIVYGGPPTLQGIFDIYAAIVDDNVADVSNSSIGFACELEFTAPYNGGVDLTYILRDFHDLYRQGNAQGITFVQASGDSGALACPNVAGTHAIFGVGSPMDDPDVTDVGGTNLVTSYIPGSLRSTYVRENAYDDPLSTSAGFLPGSVFGSGGGKSVIFGKPLYQYFVDTHASTRAVPDVSLHSGGCPIGAVTPCGPDRSADLLLLAGGFYGVIGTSLSAQDFGGLQAIQDEQLFSRQGNVNYIVYSLAAIGSVGNGPIYHNDIPGNNGYPSHKGYNFVVGNGSVRGAQYAVDPFGPFAGDPHTASNP